MMANGLLGDFGEFIRTPEGQGLLSAAFGGMAGARQGTPWNNLGRAGVAGVMGYGGALDRQQQMAIREQQQKLQDAQISNYNSEVEQRKAAIEKQAKMQEMISQIMGGAPSPAGQGQLGSGTFGTLPTVGGAPDIPPQQQGSWLTQLPLEKVVGLKMVGGPDLTKDWELGQTGVEMKPGSVYKNGATMNFGPPKVADNVQLTGDGRGGFRAMAVPGAPQALSEITTAQEAAKANLDLVSVPQSDGTTKMMPRSSAVRSLSSGQPAPSGMQSGYVGGSKEAAASGQIDIIKSELAKPNNSPQDTAALQRELARLQGNQTPNAVLGVSQSPADAAIQSANKTQLEAQAKDVAAQRSNIMNASFGAGSNIAKYQQIGKLLEGVDGGTLTSTGTNLASTMNSLGFKIDKNLPNKEAAAALGNEMALQLRSPANGAGMPGAMSDSDRQFLVSLIPNANQSAQGRKQLIDSAIKLEVRKQQIGTFARAYEKKYGKLDNGFFDQMQAWSNANPLFGGQ
jgi:hypothetical protein